MICTINMILNGVCWKKLNEAGRGRELILINGAGLGWGRPALNLPLCHSYCRWMPWMTRQADKSHLTRPLKQIPNSWGTKIEYHYAREHIWETKPKIENCFISIKHPYEFVTCYLTLVRLVGKSQIIQNDYKILSSKHTPKSHVKFIG